MKILCPICKNELILKNKSFKCINNHTFDKSKNGYLNLSLKHNSGDNKDMISSRTCFLEKDYYLPLKSKLIEIINTPDSLLDLACGEGYYTKDFMSHNKYAVDLSKDAIAYASKKDKFTNYIISSIFDLPFENTTFDCITTIFAPLSTKEIQRILKPYGKFIFVLPNEKHLYELKQIIYDNPYLNKTEKIEIDGLSLTQTINLEYQFNIDNNQTLQALFKMTPYYYKTDKKDAAKLDNVKSLTLTASFIILVFEKTI